MYRHVRVLRGKKAKAGSKITTTPPHTIRTPMPSFVVVGARPHRRQRNPLLPPGSRSRSRTDGQQKRLLRSRAGTEATSSSESSHGCVRNVPAVRVAEAPHRRGVQGGDEDGVRNGAHHRPRRTAAGGSRSFRLGIRGGAHGVEGHVQTHRRRLRGDPVRNRRESSAQNLKHTGGSNGRDTTVWLCVR